MSASRCVTVIAGSLDDLVFNHLCHIAESLADRLPNFYFETITKRPLEWKPWLRETCARYNWSHTKSPLIWRKIGITSANVNYVGGANQFWELLYKYYKITSNLTKEDLEVLQRDLLFIHETKREVGTREMSGVHRRVTIIGAGRSLCPDLIPQLIMTRELWLSHGVIVNLYDKPGHFFKLRRIVKDVEGIGGGLRAAAVLDNIPESLRDCDILIYLDALPREEHENTESWLYENYKSMAMLSKQIDEYAPSHMKVIFCSMGPTCFCVNVMHNLVRRLSKNNIVAVSAHYGLEVMHAFVTSLGFSPQNFGCPPVWGFLGISSFVDVCHMVQKHDIYRPNNRALYSNKNSTLPLGTRHPYLRWFFYAAHDKNPYKDFVRRKETTQYQVGRMERFQNCSAICDLLRLWYSNAEVVGDEIISLGISSNGTFGIPKEVVFSQPVSLKMLDDNSRVWVPFGDFPMPNMSMSFFQNLVQTATIITEKFTDPNCESTLINNFTAETVDTE